MARPIDADALKSELQRLRMIYYIDFAMTEIDVASLGAISLIDKAPTIDYEPVIHSQWILHNMNPRRVTVDGYVVCPECEHTFDRIKGTWFKRCPNCGAKMGD